MRLADLSRQDPLGHSYTNPIILKMAFPWLCRKTLLKDESPLKLLRAFILAMQNDSLAIN